MTRVLAYVNAADVVNPGRWERFRRPAAHVLLVLLVLLYPVVCTAFLRITDCVAVESHPRALPDASSPTPTATSTRVMRSDTTVACFEGAHLVTAAAGFACCVVYLLGLPVAACMSLLLRRYCGVPLAASTGRAWGFHSARAFWLHMQAHTVAVAALCYAVVRFRDASVEAVIGGGAAVAAYLAAVLVTPGRSFHTAPMVWARVLVCACAGVALAMNVVGWHSAGQSHAPPLATTLAWASGAALCLAGLVLTAIYWMSPLVV
jgi:hypothetical protein